ncbi:MAG TPA: L-dopachrome tautomerase-related protein, partial [Polyangiaceae bacterium]|nr:L-dopachrome tautomerase-related protein [Polyangiaceae bacterium]
MARVGRMLAPMIRVTPHPASPAPAAAIADASSRSGPSAFRRRAALALGLFALAVGALLAFVKWAYGGGQPYPNVGTAPLVAEGRLETLVELALPPGNVTSSRGGRVFFNTHPFVQSHRFADAFLFELVDGVPRPYPDAAAQADLAFVFGMTVDALDRLWLISPATLDRSRTRVFAYDLATNRRVFDHEFEPGVARFAQDLRVAPDGRTLYLADTGAFHFTDGSIVVVELGGANDWRPRATLQGHPSTKPQDWFIRTAAGPYRLGHGLLTFAVGVDGVALSPDGAWLYYGAMSHDSLYRVRTEHLRDASLSAEALGARVERVGPKPLSDGIEVLPDGSVLITDVENGGLARLDAGGALRTLVRRDGLVWADGVTVAPDGAALFTDSAIPSYIDPLLRPPARERLAAGA